MMMYTVEIYYNLNIDMYNKITSIEQWSIYQKEYFKIHKKEIETHKFQFVSIEQAWYFISGVHFLGVLSIVLLDNILIKRR